MTPIDAFKDYATYSKLIKFTALSILLQITWFLHQNISYNEYYILNDRRQTNTDSSRHHTSSSALQHPQLDRSHFKLGAWHIVNVIQHSLPLTIFNKYTPSCTQLPHAPNSLRILPWLSHQPPSHCLGCLPAFTTVPSRPSLFFRWIIFTSCPIFTLRTSVSLNPLDFRPLLLGFNSNELTIELLHAFLPQQLPLPLLLPLRLLSNSNELTIEPLPSCLPACHRDSFKFERVNDRTISSLPAWLPLR